MLRALLLYTLLLLPLSGCELLGLRSSSGPETQIVVKGDEPFKLQIEQEAVVTDYDLTLQFTQVVGDSRCARNVECVWEGEVQVAFLLTQANREMAFSIKGFPTGKAGEGAPAAEVLGFRFTLLEMTPYPVYDARTNQIVRDGTPTVKLLVEAVE